jgi:1-acyl-sn-glycerol-3-phosphate acyltransferase
MFGKGLPFFPRFTAVVFRCMLAPFTRVKVEGRQNIPPTGPLLIVCNHASTVDGPVLMAYFAPAMGRALAWLGKEEALRWPVFGYPIRHNGVIGIRRGAGDLEAFRTVKQVLDDGRPLVIFPEGTRSKDGALQAAKEGATVLALRSGAPILPVAIVGAHRFWPRSKKLPRPFRRMGLRIGPVFHLTVDRGTDRHEATRAATAELMRHIAELLPPEQRGVYGETGSSGGVPDAG